MSARFSSSDSTDLRKVMAEKIPAFQEEVKKFRKDHGDKVIGEITVDQVDKIYIFFYFFATLRILSPGWVCSSKINLEV